MRSDIWVHIRTQYLQWRCTNMSDQLLLALLARLYNHKREAVICVGKGVIVSISGAKPALLMRWNRSLEVSNFVSHHSGLTLPFLRLQLV